MKTEVIKTQTTWLDHPKYEHHPTFSIISPVHNEEAVIQRLYERIRSVMDSTNEWWELILVNDGSSDSSYSIISNLSHLDIRVKGINLSRNFGFQAAVTAGMDYARGDAVILIDADLQDPPEVILQMIEKWKEGYDVVFGQREERDGETWFKKTTASIFYRFLSGITQINIPVDTGDFRLMDRRVVDIICNMPERHRYLRGMISWVGFNQTGVTYKRFARFAGKTKFNTRKMINFAIDAITGFSSAPLQLASLLGFAMAGFSGLAIIAVILLRLFGHSVPFMGQASTLVAVLFLGGVQLICLGIIGEYIGRINEQTRNRPLYLVEHTSGLEAITIHHP